MGGFGFIQPEDGGDDVFCHVTGLKDGEGSVDEGDTVRFKVSYDDRKGKDRAVDVVRSGGGGGKGGDTRPGDWECPGCGINVFASKNECFKCGEQKPTSRGGRDDDRRGGRDNDRKGGRDGDRGRRRRDRSDSRRR